MRRSFGFLLFLSLLLWAGETGGVRLLPALGGQRHGVPDAAALRRLPGLQSVVQYLALQVGQRPQQLGLGRARPLPGRLRRPRLRTRYASVPVSSRMTRFFCFCFCFITGF